MALSSASRILAGRLGCPRRSWRGLLCSLCSPVAALAGAAVVLFATEAPVLNSVLGYDEAWPVAYHSASVQLAVLGGLRDSDFDELPLQPHAAGHLHFVYATKSAGCPVRLTRSYMCAIEAAMRRAPSTARIHFWVFRPPVEVAGADWQPCPAVSAPIPGVQASLDMKPLSVERQGRFGAWYHRGNHTRELWALYGAAITDFARLYVLDTWGGFYLDTDVVVGDSRFFYLSDGAGLQGDDPFSAHRLNNAVMRFRRGSRFVDLLASDWVERWDAFKENPSWGFSGPGSITRAAIRAEFLGRRRFDVTWYSKRHIATGAWHCRNGTDLLAIHLLHVANLFEEGGGLARGSGTDCIREYLHRSCPVAAGT